MDARQQYLDLVRSRPELFVNPPGAAFHILLGESEMHQAESSVADRLRRNGAPTE
jgi:hypothetical protein